MIRHIVKRYYNLLPNNGTYIIDEDWDNLIILDACRYDSFCEVLGQSVDYRISRGSNTVSFLRENFGNGRFKDIVYFTANPHVNLICKGKFHKIIPLWDFGWDTELNTVLPKTVYDTVLSKITDYQDKRVIVHFIQPHYPYLRDPDLILFGRRYNKYGMQAAIDISKRKDIQNPTLIREMKRYHISFNKHEIKKVYAAYVRNLELVLPYAIKLAKLLDGKSVITSDHGNAFNEYAIPFPVRIMDHPEGIFIKELVKVPWMVID